MKEGAHQFSSPPVLLHRGHGKPADGVEDLLVHVQRTVAKALQGRQDFEINILAMAGTLLEDILSKVGQDSFQGKLRVIICDPFSKAVDRRGQLERQFAPGAKMQDRSNLSAKAFRRFVPNLGVKEEDSIRWIDTLPSYFLLRIGNSIYFHPYLHCSQGSQCLVYFFEDWSTVPFASALVTDFGQLWERGYYTLRYYPDMGAERPEAVSLDLDGTVLNAYHAKVDFEYLDLLENYIRVLRERLHIPVVASTGRSRAFVEGALTSRFADCFTHYVLENGCVVVKDDITSKSIVEFSSSQQQGVDLLRFIETYFRANGIIYEWCKEHMLTFTAKDLGVHQSFIEKLISCRDGVGLDVVKHDSADPAAMKYDVGVFGLSKLSGIKAALSRIGSRDKRNFDLKKVLHIGDSENDEPILREVGWRGIVPKSINAKGQPVYNPKLLQVINDTRGKGDATVLDAKSTVARGAYEILVRAFGNFFLED